MLDIPYNIYNWLMLPAIPYYSGHSHCTKYRGQMLEQLEISASIIQGSAIGPASFNVSASDLTAISPGNILCKYADDTYIIIPVQNADTSVRRRVQPPTSSLATFYIFVARIKHITHIFPTVSDCQYFSVATSHISSNFFHLRSFFCSRTY